jgi:hypothetical protein
MSKGVTDFLGDLLAAQSRLGDHPGAAAEQKQRSGDRERHRQPRQRFPGRTVDRDRGAGGDEDDDGRVQEEDRSLDVSRTPVVALEPGTQLRLARAEEVRCPALSLIPVPAGRLG